MSQYNQKLIFTYANGKTYTAKQAKFQGWDTANGVITYHQEREHFHEEAFGGVSLQENTTTYSTYCVKDSDVLSLEIIEANSHVILKNPELAISVRVDIMTPKQRRKGYKVKPEGWWDWSVGGTLLHIETGKSYEIRDVEPEDYDGSYVVEVYPSFDYGTMEGWVKVDYLNEFKYLGRI